MFQVQDETEINWGNLLDSEWNLWTARDLRRRWNIWKTDAKQVFPTMEYQGWPPWVGFQASGLLTLDNQQKSSIFFELSLMHRRWRILRAIYH